MYSIEKACEDFDLIVECLGYEEACNSLFKAMSIDDKELYLSAIINDWDLKSED